VSESKTASPPLSPERDLAAEFLDRSTPLTRIRAILHRFPALSPAVVLVVSIIVFGLINPRFIAPANLSLISQQVAVVGTIGIAQTLIILTAGIDLSVGAAATLAAFVIAQTATANHVPSILSLLLGLAVGLATGLLNGVLVTRMKLPPFIVTLGTLSIFTAIVLLYSNSASIETGLPASVTALGSTFSVFGVQITYGVVLMIVIYAVVAVILGRTAWGRHVYAVGDDPEAARLAGIRVSRVMLSVYLVAGAILAFGAWQMIGRADGIGPNDGSTVNLESITAVVIGGTSLFGGRGTVWGTLLGALIVGVFEEGLAVAGLDVLYQVLAVGILIIVAVGLDQWIRKVRK
jgi:fructose transport system permease protein